MTFYTQEELILRHKLFVNDSVSANFPLHFPTRVRPIVTADHVFVLDSAAFFEAEHSPPIVSLGPLQPIVWGGNPVSELFRIADDKNGLSEIHLMIHLYKKG